ncbi:hypothetical protein N665_0135s0047, partial [Sinapis alba]
YDVTFIIRRPDQRPWAPPIGFQCVYESFFQEDSKLWFPIPSLITSYCVFQDIDMTQLMIGAVRIDIALMVTATKINVSMYVRVFEEWTQTQPKPNGLFVVQMRSGLHILTGHPSNMKLWQLFYFYVKADKTAFEDPPDKRFRVLWNYRIVDKAHAPEGGIADPASGEMIDQPTEFCPPKKNKKKGKTSKKSVADPSADKVYQEDGDRSENPRPDSPEEPAEKESGRPSGTKRKRASNEASNKSFKKRHKGPIDRSAGNEGEYVDRSAEDEGDPVFSAGLPTKKESPLGGHRVLLCGSDPLTERPSLATSECIEFLYDGDEPFVNSFTAYNALMCQIRGGTRLMQEVSEIALSDKYADSACADAVVALRRMRADLQKAAKRIKEKNIGFERERRERSSLEKAAVEEAEIAKREMDRLKLSRLRGVVCERDRITAGITRQSNKRFEKFCKYLAARDVLESKLLFHSQAVGTTSVELLEKWGLQIPQKLKDIHTYNEVKFKKEVEDVEVEVITEKDLVLSPLRLEPDFHFDQLGSNLGLVDSVNATSIRSPAFADENPVIVLDKGIARRSRAIASVDCDDSSGSVLET